MFHGRSFFPSRILIRHMVFFQKDSEDNLLPESSLVPENYIQQLVCFIAEEECRAAESIKLHFISDYGTNSSNPLKACKTVKHCYIAFFTDVIPKRRSYDRTYVGRICRHFSKLFTRKENVIHKQSPPSDYR